jgi:ribosomal protein L12E/L44/L45/RPP1/RPP2
MPDIVRAAAEPFAHVGQFTVLNGAQGVTSALGDVIQQAGALVGIARRTITPMIGPLNDHDDDDHNHDAAAKPAAKPTAAASAKAAAKTPAPTAE